MYKKCTRILTGFLVISAGIISNECNSMERKKYTLQQEQDARKIQNGKDFYQKGKGTPAQFMTDQRAKLNNEGAVVRKAVPGDYANAVHKLSALYQKAELGFKWRQPVLKIRVSHLATPPVIDGTIRKNEWEKASCFEGEYILNQTTKTAAEKSLWYIGWTNTNLYIAARFYDSDLHIFDGTLKKPGTKIYEGDSLEFFIRPRLDQRLYYELIVNPSGKSWCLMHANNPWGGHVHIGGFDNEGQKIAATHDKKGYTVEISIPFKSLHGFWCRRAPGAGDQFGFMFVRTNRTGTVHSKSSPVPFLYDGHNIFGYINATLK